MSRLYTKQLGPYELVRRLGHGGMAETFLAVRRGPGDFVQEVCIKRLLPHRAAEPSTLRAFVREGHLVAALHHPNIVRILELGEHEGEPYLVLELIDGLDLRAILRARAAMRRPLPAPLVAHLAVHLSAALHAAHTAVTSSGVRGIFHRDLSPENVLIGRAGEVKLVDFGIARPVEEPSTTATGVVKGKADYMAPEYARTGDFDARCDQFSLGVVLYECLTGSRPHHGRTEIEVLQHASDGEHARVGEVAANVPAALDAFVERLLVPDPEGRFATPDALLDAAHGLEAPSRAARELGALVDALHPARGPYDAVQDDPDAGGAAQATAHLQSADGTPRGRRLQRAALALAALGSLAAGGALLARRQSTAPHGTASSHETPAAAATNDPSATAVTDEPPANDPSATPSALPPRDAPDAEPAKSSTQVAPRASAETTREPARTRPRPEQRRARPARTPARPASLEVVVVPFGKVWVDGELRGEAPLQLSLKPGAHRIAVGRKQATLSRRIELDPGERRQLVLKL